MQIEEQVYPNAICGTTPQVLEAIHQEENSIAIYERDIQSLNQELFTVINQEFKFQTSGTKEEIASDLKAFFDEKLPASHLLLQDIIEQVHLFEKVVESDGFRLLLATVNSNMCRKFHTDINDLRLLCTYAGKGTLWVAEDAQRRIEDDEIPIDQVHQANTGDVLILKGALHPQGNPILHRSPSIEETGGKRLLLRIDTNNLMSF